MLFFMAISQFLLLSLTNTKFNDFEYDLLHACFVQMYLSMMFSTICYVTKMFSMIFYLTY